LISKSSKKKNSIVVLGCKGLPFTGGLEIIMEEIGRRFVDDGYRFDVFIRRHYTPDGQRPDSHKGIGLRYSPGIHSKHFDTITHSFTALTETLLEPYDLVYINTIGLSTLGFIPKILRKKVIIQVHGLDFQREKWNQLAKLYLKFSCYTTARFADRIICVSAEDKAYFDSRFKTNCVYIPNGVSIKEKIDPEIIKERWGLTSKSYILFMARLVKEKGCHFLLDAYRNLETDKTLVVAGDNSHKESYSQVLKQQNSERIKFVGFVDDRIKDELLSNAYCYVLPSTLEAMPLSILEAMSFGNCILASDLPAIRSILGSSGIYFRAGDILDLKDRLSFVLSNPELATSQGVQHSEYVAKNHNWDNIYMKYKELINQVLTE
jgi:glycosyltransferase involved in cell wall biosynthesis